MRLRPSPSLAAVDLAAHQRDGLLIDPCRIPGLDGGEVGLTGLVAAPARQPCARKKFAVELSALAALSRLPVP